MCTCVWVCMSMCGGQRLAVAVHECGEGQRLAVGIHECGGGWRLAVGVFLFYSPPFLVRQGLSEFECAISARLSCRNPPLLASGYKCATRPFHWVPGIRALILTLIQQAIYTEPSTQQPEHLTRVY